MLAPDGTGIESESRCSQHEGADCSGLLCSTVEKPLDHSLRGIFMKVCFLTACCLLLCAVSGCSSLHSAGGMKIVATSIDDFERQANRLCPFGYDILGEAQIFVEGQSNSRFIHCRHQTSRKTE